MDVAYDHIQEEALSPDEATKKEGAEQQQGGLNSEFQEAFKAVSSSAWGAKLGGFFGQVKKQGESFYSEAQREYNNASTQATQRLNELQSTLAERTKNISISQPSEGDNSNTSFSDPTFALPESVKSSTTTAKAPSTTTEEATERPESLPADILKEATSLVSRFRGEAAKRLKDVQKAEDAADEALLKFGTNLRDFLRDAVTVTAPPDSDKNESEVLFETNDAEGKRIFHSSRFDAQLHVIHTTAASFTKDAAEGEEWEKWKDSFDVEKNTERIAEDLDKYEELRRAMGRLVPEKVDYSSFWRRYYFLRTAIEEEEKKRKEVLKGAAAEPDEEIGWGSDDEEEEDSATPVGANAAAKSSTTTLTASAAPETATSAHNANTAADKEKLKPVSHSEEDEGKSTADSDTSYDIVSGATSKTPGSPKEEAKDEKTTVEKKKEEESDDEDWE